jgi:hypothetical protein
MYIINILNCLCCRYSIFNGVIDSSQVRAKKDVSSSRALEVTITEATHNTSCFRFKKQRGCAMSKRNNVKSVIIDVRSTSDIVTSISATI